MRTNTTQLSTTNHISKKQLSELQIEVLKILYKFRFSNSKLISQYQGQSIRNINVRLSNLLTQEYIGRNYDSSYRIKHLSATYFLLPKAIKILKADPELDPKGLHLLYYNRTAKQAFINHWLRIFRIYLKLDELYQDNLEFFTSTEIAEQTSLPRPLPDVLLKFSGQYANTPDYMLELVDSNKSLVRNKQRINRYISHYEQGSWEHINHPRILLIFDNIGLERELQRHIARTLNNKAILDLTFYTTTLKALYSSTKTQDNIYSNVLDPKILTSLS